MPSPPAIRWLDKLLPAVIQMSIFGGSITFSVIISVPDCNNQKEDIIKNLCIAFLMFALALFIASGAELVLCFQREDIEKVMKNTQDPATGCFQKIVNCLLYLFFCIGILSLILQVLPLLAFVFLALVVESFNKTIGRITLWFMASFAILAFLIWACQTFLISACQAFLNWVQQAFHGKKNPGTAYVRNGVLGGSYSLH